MVWKEKRALRSLLTLFFLICFLPAFSEGADPTITITTDKDVYTTEDVITLTITTTAGITNNVANEYIFAQFGGTYGQFFYWQPGWVVGEQPYRTNWQVETGSENILENYAINGALPGIYTLYAKLMGPGFTTISRKTIKVIDTLNYVALHDSSSPQYNRNCTDCHADVLTQPSLDPFIPNAHVAMFPFASGRTNNEKCVSCHETVDLLQGSAGNLLKNVAAESCVICHGPGGPGKQFYQR